MKDISYKQLSYIWDNTPTDEEEFSKFTNDVLTDGKMDQMMIESAEICPITKESMLCFNRSRTQSSNIIKVCYYLNSINLKIVWFVILFMDYIFIYILFSIIRFD